MHCSTSYRSSSKWLQKMATVLVRLCSNMISRSGCSKISCTQLTAVQIMHAAVVIHLLCTLNATTALQTCQLTVHLKSSQLAEGLGGVHPCAGKSPSAFSEVSEYSYRQHDA